jgi:ribonuclease P protein component
MDFASGCRQKRVEEYLIDGEQKVGLDSQVETAGIPKQVPMRFSFKKEDRILKRSEFLELTQSGRKLQNDCVIAFFAPGRYNRPRLGITVTRKVGSAAQRNRIKRLIREYFRLNRQHLKQNRDINIVAKPKAADLSSEKVFSALQDLFEKISNCVD